MESPSLSESIVKLQVLLDSAKTHAASLEKGVKAASSKCRSDLLAISKLTSGLRKLCVIIKSDIPIKPRTRNPKEDFVDPVDSDEEAEPLENMLETDSSDTVIVPEKETKIPVVVKKPKKTNKKAKVSKV